MERTALRSAAYIAAVLATLFGAGGGVIGFVGMFTHLGGAGVPPQLQLVALAMGGVPLLVIAGLFSYLAWKPNWWGKLVCLVGVPWIMFSIIIESFGELWGVEQSPLFLLPALGGGVLLVVGVTLVVLDRGRVFGGRAA